MAGVPVRRRKRHAEEMQIPGDEFPAAALGVVEVRVARIDDQIARRKRRRQLAKHGIDYLACRHEQDDGPRQAQPSHKRLGIGRAPDRAAGALLLQTLRLGRIGVEPGNGVAVVREVEQEITAHHAQADHAEIRCIAVHRLSLTRIEGD